MTATISVNRWDDYQHYRERDPPWIKLYRDVLTSEPWVLGTDASRLVQIGILLLAARYKNEIPYNLQLMKRICSLDCEEAVIKSAIEFLSEMKFLKIHGVTETRLQPASMPPATCSTQNENLYSREGKGIQGKGIQIHVELDGIDAVQRVFGHWQRVWNKPRSKLDAKRRLTITKALKLHDAETLCQSISGYRNSPHHMGNNDRHTTYDDIALFLRDAAHIEAGLNFHHGPSKRIAKTADELEAEERERHDQHGP